MRVSTPVANILVRITEMLMETPREQRTYDVKCHEVVIDLKFAESAE